ncbi:MAG: hypothetical protein MUO53_02735 [Maribacter sp.]|nr:hypothetical protein [Maribacter sp.]
MDLDEIKATWSQMSDQLEQQKKLTDKIILEMTQQKYKNKFSKISMYETIGAVVCYVMAFYILLYMKELDTWYLLTLGIFTLGCLLVMPFLVLRSLKNIQRVDLVNSNYKEALIKYTQEKNRLLFLQRLGIYLGFFMLCTSLPVFSKINNGKDLFLSATTWLWYLPVMGVFFFFFARWGYRSYRSITDSAENILNEMDQ